MEVITRKEAKQRGDKYYWTGTPCPHGHDPLRLVSNGSCYGCTRDSKRTWVENNPERYRQSYLDRHIPAHQQTAQQYLARKIVELRARAKAKGLAFSITIDDLTIPEVCPVLGIPLVVGVGNPTDNAPSVDRIDDTRGYIPGNVQVISWRANRIKTDATVQELKKIVEHMELLTTTSS